jgi:hypothetical protein
MATFKKIKVSPVTELDSLNLQKATEKHYDLTGLPPDKVKELFEKVMDIARKNPGVVVGKPVGGKQYVSAAVSPSKQKGKTFAVPEPNVIHLYYKIAVNHLDISQQKKQEFLAVVNQHPEEEYQRFCDYLEEITQGIVFLLMTVEGFINQLPHENATYQINGEARTKHDIEWMNVTDKLRLAVPAITGIDIYTINRPIYDRLHLLNGLRNDLIHLKKIEQANFTYYQALFKRLLDFPAPDCADAVFDFINTVQAAYFTEEANP